MGVTIEDNLGTALDTGGTRPDRPAAHATRLPSRRNPTVRAIAREWRRLTAPTDPRIRDTHRRTLLAVSGGADSVALLLALAAATGRSRTGLGGVAHIVHDLRPPEQARADRDAVAALADALRLPFLERAVATDPTDNPERSARDARYGALAELAAEAGCPFVATAHHADDQLESIVMALVRGAGPDGLRGIAPTRPLPGRTTLPSRASASNTTITLIRPCLTITRADAERLCDDAGVAWRIDPTNADTTRLRAALRHGPLRELVAIRPRAARRASQSARLMRDAAGLVRDRAREVFADDFSWPRDRLRAERRIVIGAGLRGAALRLTGGTRGDALTRALLDPAIDAIRGDTTDPRSFDWPGCLTLEVTAHDVRLNHPRSECATSYATRD